MDPKAAIEIVNDSSECTERRTEALVNLHEWLYKGGFVPCGESFEDMHLGFTKEAIETMKAAYFGDMACAVNVAIRYGDLSGLDAGEY